MFGFEVAVVLWLGSNAATIEQTSIATATVDRPRFSIGVFVPARPVGHSTGVGRGELRDPFAR